MNKNNWYLAEENKWLYDRQALDYVTDKLNISKRCMEDISRAIETINELIGSSNESVNIYDEYLDTAEKISLIEISLEMILEDIRRYNDND